jgi:hypothetical protein
MSKFMPRKVPSEMKGCIGSLDWNWPFGVTVTSKAWLWQHKQDEQQSDSSHGEAGPSVVTWNPAVVVDANWPAKAHL